jgi:hypothetical protein
LYRYTEDAVLSLGHYYMLLATAQTDSAEDREANEYAAIECFRKVADAGAGHEHSRS